MTASNTHECFTEFIGQKVTGVLFDALPDHRRDLARGTKTLIFEDGRGLTISSHGTYWIDSVKDIQHALKRAEEELRKTQARLANVLFAAGFAP